MQLINTGKRVKPNKNKIQVTVSSQYCQKRTCAGCKDLTLFILECFKSVRVGGKPFSAQNFFSAVSKLPGGGRLTQNQPVSIFTTIVDAPPPFSPVRYSMSSTSVRGMRAARRNSACTRGRKPGLPRQPCVFGSPTCRCWRGS
uniref:Uncharacterized protein n=1 Tax=Pseudonaja textilis TaxID=8673 RepID=A0A670ZMQ0_PSETE